MTDEIKEILFLLHNDRLTNSGKRKLEDYITNLQQDLDKANDIIEKDRQFYKCRMDEYVELKKENEFLKLNNPEMNIEHFRIVKENKRKIDNLRKENKILKEQNNDLRKIYRNTYKRLFKNRNDELARYFQAQIDDCPTFYVEPIIDYAKEYKIYKSRCKKAIEYINFVIKHYKEQLKTPIEDTYFDSDVNRKGYILSIIAYLQTILDILNGSDEE